MCSGEKIRSDRVFLPSLFFNFIFHSGWGAAVLLLWALHTWMGIPDAIWKIALPIWFVWPLLITIFLVFITRDSNPDTMIRENKNPYSAKSDIPAKEVQKANTNEAPYVYDILEQKLLKNNVRSGLNVSSEDNNVKAKNSDAKN